MVKALLLVSIGVGIGFVMAVVVFDYKYADSVRATDVHNPDAQDLAGGPRQTESSTSTSAGQCTDRPYTPFVVDDDTASAQRALSGQSSGGSSKIQAGVSPNVVPTTMPDVYKGLLLPPEYEPEPLPEAHELHASFLREDRDNVWAATIEAGVTNFLSADVNQNGTTIEHVECRTSVCEFAGYVEQGFEDSSDTIIDAMRNAEWWDLTGTPTSSAAYIEGTYRFVVVVPRIGEYAVVEPGAIDYWNYETNGRMDIANQYRE